MTTLATLIERLAGLRDDMATRIGEIAIIGSPTAAVACEIVEIQCEAERRIVAASDADTPARPVRQWGVEAEIAAAVRVTAAEDGRDRVWACGLIGRGVRSAPVRTNDDLRDRSRISSSQDPSFGRAV